MATKKKPAPRAAAKGRRKPVKKAELDRRWSILLFGLGVLFLALSFVPGESAWAWIRLNILFGTFGILGWVTGPLLLYWAVLIGLEKPVFPVIIKTILFMLAFSGAALVFSSTDLTGQSFAEILATLLADGQSKFGGGLLSLVLGVPLLLLAGRPAANILLVILVIIAAMVLTGVTPGDVVRFFSRLIDRIPARQQYEDDEDEYYYEEEEYYEEPAPAPAPVRAAPRRRAPVDIDLGPPEPKSQPGLGENDEVDIGPGGTFGLNPLDAPQRRPAAAGPGEEPLMPFDPHSKQSLFDDDAAGGNMLLFGEDDPYAHLGGAESKIPRGNLFDVEYVPQPGAAPEFDLFGRAVAQPPRQPAAVQPAAVQPAAVPAPAAPGGGSLFDETTPAPILPVAGGGLDATSQFAARPRNPFAEGGAPAAAADGPAAGEAPTAGPSVDALIDKAAAVKDDGAVNPAADSRPAAGVFEPYHYPPVTLFAANPPDNNAGAREEMKKTADLLVGTLASFGVQTRILDVSRGPSVTRYEVQPQAGVKISRITNLADDIALNLAAAGVRIEAPIPGKPAVGIEVPNRVKSTVSIRSILESQAFTAATSPLSVALGKDIAGDCVVADLTKMPHLLIAGSTGSGKSVCVNATIMSFVYRSSPEDVRLLLIDPKVVELAEYNGIPHLLMPVVTEPRKAASALGAAVAEMERRYHLFAEYNVRDIRTFNKLALRQGEMEKLPYIAIVIDELADLMMTAGKEVEDYICRIAQKARAAGMHLIVATQRPSVDVITGLIKANIPSRIAFAVSSQVDSRTILDGAGAEKLLGMGDMLFMPVGANKPVRVQGTYVKDKEISSVLRYIKQSSETRYDESMIEEMERRAAAEGSGGGDEGGDANMLRDETFVNAVETALEMGEISTSFLQRRLRLGYARAGRLVDEMERLGIISGPNGSKPRQVLIGRQQWLEMSMNGMDNSQ